MLFRVSKTKTPLHKKSLYYRYTTISLPLHKKVASKTRRIRQNDDSRHEESLFDDARRRWCARRRGTPTFSLVKEIKKTMRHGNIHHPQRRDALKHRNAFVSSSAGGEGGTRGGEESDRDGENSSGGSSLNASVGRAGSFGGLNAMNGHQLQREHNHQQRMKKEKTKTAHKTKAKAWFYRYLQIAFIVFLITCSIAFAEFIYERLLFEHSEIKEHPHGKTLFIGSAVVVVACWTMLVVVVVLSY